MTPTTTELPDRLRERFLISTNAEGALVVEQTREYLRRDLLISASTSLPLWGIALFAAYQYFQIAGWKMPSLSDPFLWIFVVLAAIGVSQLLSLLVMGLGRQQWIARENELVRRVQLFGRAREHRYHDAKLLIRRRVTSSGVNRWYILFVRPQHGRMRRIYISLKQAVIQDLAALLGEHVGWPVEKEWKE